MVGLVTLLLIFFTLAPIVRIIFTVIGWIIGAAVVLMLAPIIFLVVFIWEEFRASVGAKPT